MTSPKLKLVSKKSFGGSQVWFRRFLWVEYLDGCSRNRTMLVGNPVLGTLSEPYVGQTPAKLDFERKWSQHAPQGGHKVRRGLDCTCARPIQVATGSSVQRCSLVHFLS